MGFNEHGLNSNAQTARVTWINASNSGLLLSCQNGGGLYIYKNRMQAWIDLDMNHNSIINSSDERLKTNIVPFAKSVLPELCRLGIVSYEWKETGEQVKAGFTAQNMQSVFPELVEANDAGILGNQNPGAYALCGKRCAGINQQNGRTAGTDKKSQMSAGRRYHIFESAGIVLAVSITAGV